MKKITFKLKTKTEQNMIPLMEEIDKISCRMKLNTEDNIIIVQDVSDNMIETVIDLIQKYYSISEMKIDNIFESKPNILSDKHIENNKTDDGGKFHWEFNSNFEGKYLKSAMEKFVKYAEEAMLKSNIPESKLAAYIVSSRHELIMQYLSKDLVKFEVGDIVTCNYGTHLTGEAQGFCLCSIVCDTSKYHMAYLVPIYPKASISQNIMDINVNDVTLYDSLKLDNALYLDRGKYVNSIRVQKVVGKVKPEFLQKLLKAIAKNYNFVKKGNPSSSNNKYEEDSQFELVHVNKKSFRDSEKAVFEAILPQLTKLDTKKPIPDQLDAFLEVIGMPVDNELVKQSFVIAPSLIRITGPVLNRDLKEKFSTFSKVNVQSELKTVFRYWLTKYPKLAENFPKLSFYTLLKVYVKAFCK